jgi:hypothetical protein
VKLVGPPVNGRAPTGLTAKRTPPVHCEGGWRTEGMSYADGALPRAAPAASHPQRRAPFGEGWRSERLSYANDAPPRAS